MILTLSTVAGLCRAEDANIPGEEDVLPQACATDPIYRDFEAVQIQAYQSDTRFRFLLNPDLQTTMVEQGIEAIRQRSLEHTGMAVAPGFDLALRREMARLRVPTCYENRLLYFMIAKYARDVETAGRELGLVLGARPRFGSLPSSDINAYTYPSEHGRGGVIAINVQLFDFLYQMTALAVNAVDPEMDERADENKAKREARVITAGLLAISYNKEAQRAFVATMSGLLLGRPLFRTSVSPHAEPMVIFLAGAMERFVFAHEYGHLIRRHVSPVISRPTGITGKHENEVFARTWNQELEADGIGCDLLMQILLGSAAQYPQQRGNYIYAMKAPLFLFQCLEVLDGASEMRGTPRMPHQLTDETRAGIRRCADGKASESERDGCATYMLSTHPPAWLRRERLQVRINDRLAHLVLSERDVASSRRVEELLFSVRLFWRETAPQLLQKIRQEADQ